MTTPAFHEIRLPEHIEAGSKGGPEFNTTVIEMTSGREQRVKRWGLPRASWDISYGIMDQEDYSNVLAFFYARRGRAFGFRFKDWSDYRGVGEIIGIGDSIAIAATASLTFNSNPLTGTSVTINGQVYNLVTTNADASYKVHIGADIATTRTNLINAVNATGTPGITTYGVGTLVHPTVAASAGATAIMIGTARTGGTAGNSITVSETIDGSWNHATLTGGLASASSGSGTAVFQLIKTYDDNVLPFVRRITRPIVDTLTIYENDVEVDPTHYTINFATGLGVVTFLNGYVPLLGVVITADYEYDLPARFDSDKMTVVIDWVGSGAIDPMIIKELREGED